MKPIDVTGDSSTEYNEDSNKKDPIFKVGDHVRISKYKKIFAKGYAPNWPEESTKLVKNMNGYLVRLYRIKMSQYFPKPFNSHFGDSMKKKSICLIMQQKQTLKIFHTLILRVLH